MKNIVGKIRRILDKTVKDLVKRDNDSLKEWTKEIKTALVEEGKKLQYSPCASSIEKADWGEWLFDVCWLENHEIDEHSVVKDLILTAESKWGTSDQDIFVDFQKLLVCNATYKLMIF